MPLKTIILSVLLAATLAPHAPPTRPAPATATPALFHYRRDDAAPGRLTRVHINAAHTAAAPIQQNVFGNFVEHLGGVIYEGIWAQALLNPNLERIEDRDTQPAAWQFSGAAGWQEGGYHSPRCVRLSGPDGALAQQIYLPVQRILRYTLTLYARAPEEPGQITVALTGADARARQTIRQTPLSVSGRAWQKRTVRWSLPPGALARGEAVRFVVTHAGGGAVDVDQIEIFPDDAVDGLDPDVIRKARAWHISTLRYPGGNFASGYHWRDGVGPREDRPTRRNPAWGGIEPNSFGTDEFFDFARRIGATPQFTVNAGDGTPAEAAAWVRYCNGKALRVPIWEVGNELYGGWQIGHTDAAGNAARFVRFRDAMLRADPRIRLIATGKGDEFRPDGRARNRAWNEAVLRAARAGGGRVPDYVSIHPLVPLPADLGRFSYAEQYESALSQPALLDRTLLPELIGTIGKVEGAQARTRIAVTEWGIIVGGDRWQEGPNSDVEAAAVFSALTLNALLRHSDWVTLANITGLMHGGGIKKPHGIVIVDPQYYTQQLYSVAAPRIPVETTWDGPGRDVPERGFLPAVAGVPDVDVFSALSADRSRLLAFIVNRSLTEARPVRLDVQGFPVGAARATLLAAPDPQAHNTWERPDAVAPRPFPLPPAASAGQQNAWTVTLPPHSLAVVTLHRRGAEK